jgi:lytic murein transglycosylase
MFHQYPRLLPRRSFLMGCGALLAAPLMGCGGTSAASPAAQWPVVQNPAFDAWARGFAARVRSVPPAFAARAMAQAGFIPAVIDKDRNQTEVRRSLQDYLAIAAKPERVAMGRAKMATYAGRLNAIEARYGVDAHIVAAVWGLESFYGTRQGEVPVISALATLAFDGRRGAFFESQLSAALKILNAGDIAQSQMLGSWAGAMGHTQFIPTSYLAYAVDFTGDGRRDIWSDDPSDALASTAAYLAKSGWRRGQPWGEEVRVPAGTRAGKRSDWAAQGLRGADGGALRGAGAATLIYPAGAGGPALLLYHNYHVILRYNNAQSYAFGVGHLSDRLRGAGPLRAQFPPDATGMRIEDRAALQQKLTAAGYDTGGADGVIGAKTNAAIARYQSANGLAVTGQPSLDLLARLR